MPVPKPEPGLVIAYGYLWHRERALARKEGRKDRPSVIVLAVENTSPKGFIVTVLPITHRQPTDPSSAVELPPAVKRHLRLDDQRSWVIVSEGNVFEWPGYDLRKIRGTDRYDFGFLPPRLFRQILTAFASWHAARRANITPRT